MIISTWNVRWLNSPFKQQDVLLFLTKNKIDINNVLAVKEELAYQSLRLRYLASRKWLISYNWPPLEQKGVASLGVTNNKLQAGYAVRFTGILEILSVYNNLVILRLNFYSQEYQIIP